MEVAVDAPLVFLLILAVVFLGWIAISLQRIADDMDDGFTVNIPELTAVIKFLRKL